MTTIDELLTRLKTIVNETPLAPGGTPIRLTYADVRVLVALIDGLEGTISRNILVEPSDLVRERIIFECAGRFDPSSRQPISENQAKHRLLALLDGERS